MTSKAPKKSSAIPPSSPEPEKVPGSGAGATATASVKSESSPAGPAPPSAPAFAKADPLPVGEKRPPGRPPTSPRCEKCGLAEYDCKCKKQKIQIGERTCRNFYLVLGRGGAFFSALKSGVSYEELLKFWQFSEEELRELVPPTQDVATEYLPEWLKAYEPVAAIGIPLTEHFVRAFAMTQILAARNEAAKKNSAPADRPAGSTQPAPGPAHEETRAPSPAASPLPRVASGKAEPPPTREKLPEEVGPLPIFGHVSTFLEGGPVA